MYHYAANNPVKYTDPDGRDIRESVIKTESAGAGIAGRYSIGIAKDSNGDIAIFLKFELGIGVGGNIIKLDEYFKILKNLTSIITDIKNDYDLIDNFVKTPKDTGNGNFDGILTLKVENFNDWKTLPVEAAFLVGASGDKEGNTEIAIGATVIAAAYLAEGTLYINISEIFRSLEKIND